MENASERCVRCVVPSQVLKVAAGLIVALGTSISCRSSESPNVGAAEGRSSAASLPSVAEVAVLNVPGTGDLGHFSRVAVGPTGNVLFYSHSTERPFQLANATGDLVVSFGRDGEGPGEVRQAVPVSVTDSLITVLDRGNYRLVYWKPDGSLLGQRRLDHSGVFDVVPEREAAWLVLRFGKNGLLIDRLAYASGSEVTVLA